MNFGRNSRGTNRNPRATADTYAANEPPTNSHRCLQRGHFIYECKYTQPYKARPSRSKLLENPALLRKKGDKPSVEVPEEFKKKTGIANKILEEKEKDREAKRKRSVSPTRSSSSSSSDSSSDSDSDSSSSDSSSDSGSDSSSSSSRSGRYHKRRRRSASPEDSPKGKGKGRARSASTDSRDSR
ncbi:Zinc finger, CCHC-type [Ceratobasidium sp. AG-Ba]|nr:Zinc finger, CCHC-type [Ceratobasidium sp. AG-Ba]